jgi:hypothetical protein
MRVHHEGTIWLGRGRVSAPVPLVAVHKDQGAQLARVVGAQAPSSRAAVHIGVVVTADEGQAIVETCLRLESRGDWRNVVQHGIIVQAEDYASVARIRSLGWLNASLGRRPTKRAGIQGLASPLSSAIRMARSVRPS